MKINPSLIQAIFGMAAMIAGLYGVVTVPIIRRMDDIRSDLTLFKTETSRRLERIESELKGLSERLARVEEPLPPPLVHH